MIAKVRRKRLYKRTVAYKLRMQIVTLHASPDLEVVSAGRVCTTDHALSAGHVLSVGKQKLVATTPQKHRTTAHESQRHCNLVAGSFMARLLSVA